ncbi:MAG TPA: phosphate acyltransferase PlsX [Synergistaceae bacterium]|nr:phosphate acyltransferase PlsX [Synergistaceae bacterium]HPJ25064.1 phosphate acyltransferase PlsX [Synergistaceae bacterium]
MLLALDAMGGDHAPAEIVKGAIEACSQCGNLEIALVGDGARIEALLGDCEASPRSRLHIVHAEEIIAMDESPSVAIRKKRRSSLRIAMELVRSKEAMGCVSAGNTGAIVAGGVLVVGRIPGIDRPGLGIPLPTFDKPSLLIDVGATVRCRPINLFQFALVGEVYMRSLMHVANPEIALLSNGEEDIKGGDVLTAAREMLVNSHLNFKGYVEGREIPRGPADVMVCDGFTGNLLLKCMEGIGDILYRTVRDEVSKRFMAKLGIMLMYPMIRSLRHRFDYEDRGGSPLLGVNGVVIKAHGGSKARAVAGALRIAANFAESDGVETIRSELEREGRK